MGNFDVWVHIAEVIIVVILVPTIKSGVSILVGLRDSTRDLTSAVSEHKTNFTAHVAEDKAQFGSLHTGMDAINGNLRELIGTVKAQNK